MTHLGYTLIDDQALQAIVNESIEEQQRRRAAASLPGEIERLIEDFQATTGLGTGEEWHAPTGAHDAYREGATVDHDGREWESLTPANVWEPGVSGWREVVAEGAEPAAWVQPTGDHDAYQTGDIASFEGRVYRSLIDSNVWSPTTYPAGWEEIT